MNLSNGHSYETTFGIRKIEIRDASFYLNGERVRLMGVERMAGSNPEYGMAEPAEWIDHDHADMKDLNCVYTRVHWPQDRRVLDWCDRRGMLIQTEVPTWGPQTFRGRRRSRFPTLMNNGLEQLREMIAARPQSSLHLLVGCVQRDQRPESARLRVRQADVRGGQETRPAKAGDVRVELAPEDRRERTSPA